MREISWGVAAENTLRSAAAPVEIVNAPNLPVLIADDHAIVKEGLVSLLKEHDYNVVSAVADGHGSSTRPGGFNRT